jgi:hypothetical protein
MAFMTLGDLSEEDDDVKAIQKKLGASTKAGLDAIKSAQEGFDEPRFKLQESQEQTACIALRHCGLMEQNGWLACPQRHKQWHAHLSL